MKKKSSNKLTRKEWWMLGSLAGLALFYYALLRWVVLAHFCSEETIKMFTRTNYMRGSILAFLVALLTLVTFFAVALLSDYWKMKKEDKK